MGAETTVRTEGKCTRSILTKKYVVVSITADQEFTECVLLSMIDENLFRPHGRQDYDLGYSSRGVPIYSYPENCTRVRMDFSDYDRSNLKVGDKVSMELTKIRDGTSFQKVSPVRP